MPEVDFNPLAPGYLENPYDSYRELLTQDPVHWSNRMNAWIVTRHADVTLVLKDQRFGRGAPGVTAEQRLASVPPAILPLSRMQESWMLFKNPPEHTRLRGLVNMAFTPRTIERLRPHVQGIANRLLDGVQDRGQMDLIRDFAFPLAVVVIAELLGVPAQDQAQIREWSTVLAATVDATTDPGIYVRGAQVAQELSAYLQQIIAERRRQPQQDLISELIAAEEQGQKLTEDEMIATSVLLLVAGHETTVHTIGNSVLTLCKHPDQLELLRARPDLIPSAVEEFLRFESALSVTVRTAQKDVELGGKLIRAGQDVHALLGAANRDPAVFADPDRLDITRSPNNHLAFAVGNHYCVGAPLARLEVQIALATLLQRLPHLALASEQPQWKRSVVFRGLTALPITF
ncbi:MAG TPA: cytochrome P450 [Symbiobacteriaceae bacterium]|nr:cytochrome P450 [Symbiobacteriaceae bacterium]